MKTISRILILSTLVLSATSCLKKGEDDPLLSMRSRKARVTGEWKMTSVKSRNESGSPLDTTTYYLSEFSGNGSTYTRSGRDPWSGSFSTTGTFTSGFTFKRNGEFSYEEVYDGNVYKMQGTWNFTAGVGDEKRKAQITLTNTQSSYGNTTTSVTTNIPFQTFYIKELRNKRMILTYEIKNAGPVYSDSEWYEIVLEQ